MASGALLELFTDSRCGESRAASHCEQVSLPFRTDPHFVQINAGVNSILQAPHSGSCSSVVVFGDTGFHVSGSIGLI